MQQIIEISRHPAQHEIDRSDPWDAYPVGRYGERLFEFLQKSGVNFMMCDSVELGCCISDFLAPIETDLVRHGVPRDVAQWWCEQICLEAQACEADIG